MNINGCLLKYEDGKIWKFGKKRSSKEETWNEMKGYINMNKKYKRHVININGGIYTTSRLLYKLHHPEWDIEDCSKNNTIDHINRNSLDNRIENLRIATMEEQSLNKNYVINKKGYNWHKQKQKWRAYICIDGKHKHLGLFEFEEDARQAYLNAVASK